MCDYVPGNGNQVALDMRVKTNKTVFVNTSRENDGSTLENLEKCKEWLENCTLKDDRSTCSDCPTEDSTYASRTDCSSECSSSSRIVSFSDELNSFDNNSVANNQLQTIIGQNKNVYENIIVNNSKNVHLGNVTVINGPVFIKDGKKRKKIEEHFETETTSTEIPEHLELAYAHVRLVDRRAWLSQPPVDECDKLEKPAKYVIICTYIDKLLGLMSFFGNCHSASEDAISHADNILLVRYIQQFHIECRQWADIAYNFLIGCDGYTYKGRGWGVHGAHSFRYNAISVGICFVGTFCTKLPTQIALDQAKALIRYGVEHGEIDADYSLIGNCQVSSSRSPGAHLFQEIQTWDHYDASVSLENPSPLIEAM